MSPLRKPLPHLLFKPNFKSSSLQALVSYSTKSETSSTQISNSPKQANPIFKMAPFDPISPAFLQTGSVLSYAGSKSCLNNDAHVIDTHSPKSPKQEKSVSRATKYGPILYRLIPNRPLSTANSDPSRSKPLDSAEPAEPLSSESIPAVSTATSPYDSSQPIDAGSSIRKPISLWPGMYHSPVTNALWEARSKMYEKLGDTPIDAPSQSELVARTPAQSRTSILYKFSSDYKLREQYRNPWNEIRMGKLVEDLDALAGTIAYKHCCNEDGATRPLLLVTASVDKMVLKKPIRVDTDLNEDLQEALEHLASIDLIDLCNEAKVERCRATRDLRSCGRYVMDVLNSCGHASLCAECSQRCDVCPICRIPIPKNGKKLRRRLYDQCSEARLISKKCDKRFQEKEDGEEHISADVQRLYSLFDVALENNLVSLICHYVTDVCLDESAVSSDPVIAFLLDEVVVKDWCKRTFQNLITELQGIYNLETEQMKSMLSALLKFSAQLAGISNVLDVLDSSFKGSLSAQLQDLHQLQESILKTTQHMEAMIWCLRHEFLENVRPSNANFTSWRSLVRERKSAAIKRSWPDAVNNSEAPTGQEGTLFIEDALVNLEIEQGNTVKLVEELKLASLQKDGVSSIFRSEIEGVAGCYPFENVRAAVDILFLCGSSDLVVAKQAIFLYYLFDRHWTMPDEQWRHIVEDFGATFGIPRHLLLESLIFYLLDDHTDEALQEACHLLPEISGPATHPKIAQVLLERGNPDTALSVLRWSGRDGTSKPISLSEAVTAVRVRVECGLFTEAFIHQRMLCTKVKENKLKCGQFGDVTDDSTCKYRGWEDWVEILVTEICVLCIRRNMVDRMIELPWNSDEEKHLHKCLLDYTIDDPSSIIGSLLVVFYIQRYRYSEAYHVDQILKNAEQEFISKNSVSEEVLSRMRSMSGWRTGLIDKCMELLPEVQRQQVKAGKFPEISGATSSEVEISATCPLPEVQVSKSTSLLIPSSVDISHALWTDHMNPSWKPSISETPKKRVALVDSYRSDLGNHGSSVLHERLFTNSEMQWKPDNSINKSFNFEDASTPEIHWATPPSAVKGGNRSSFKLLSNSHLQDNQYDKMSPETEKNRSFNPFRSTSPLHYYSANSNPVTTPSSNHVQFKDSAMNPHRVSSKAYYPDRDDRPWDMVSKDDSMDISLSYGEKSFGIEDRNLNHGPRWRSDETSDEEEEQSPQKAIDITHHTPTSTTRGVRRSRFSKR